MHNDLSHSHILNKHAPIRQRKVRNKYSPHINVELKREMFLRDFYEKKHRSSGNPNDWLEYKKLRNIVNIEHANAKKDYFAYKLSQANHDIKVTWKSLNSALGRRSKTSTTTIQLMVLILLSQTRFLSNLISILQHSI